MVSDSRFIFLLRVFAECDWIDDHIGWIFRHPTLALVYEMSSILSSSYVYVLSDSITVLRYANVFMNEEVLNLMVRPSLMCIKVSVTRLGDFWTLGNFSKPLAIIILPKSSTHFRQFL